MQNITVHLAPLPLNGIRDIANYFGVSQPIVLEWVGRNAPIATIELKDKIVYHAEYNTLFAWLVEFGG